MLLIPFSYAFCTTGAICIPPEDIGIGANIRVAANPDENNTGTSKTNLIKSEPKQHQIAPWIDTGLFTTGTNTALEGYALEVGILGVLVMKIPWINVN
jgi:hypothetical protein